MTTLVVTWPVTLVYYKPRQELFMPQLTLAFSKIGNDNTKPLSGKFGNTSNASLKLQALHQKLLRLAFINPIALQVIDQVANDYLERGARMF